MTGRAQGRRRGVLYGRRKGRPLRPGRRRLMETLLPRVALPLSASAGRLDPRTLFSQAPFPDAAAPGRPDEVWLEVGFGSGEHLAAQAAAHPGTGFIGCEPFVNGVAALLARLDRDRLGNVRVFADDARLVLDRLADASLARVFVLFPDPWPKARHAKRRFIAAGTLDELARVMADGAELRVATDDMGYVRWTLARLLPRADFAWCAERAADWRTRPADQPPTRYEEKARERGARPVFLTFRRVPRRRAGAGTRQNT